SEKYVADFVPVTEVAGNLDLPERFDRDPIAHRVREHIHLFRVAGEQQTECVLEAVAGRGRAVEVVDISRGLSARRPGEQHRDAWGFRIVRELRQTVETLGEH